MRNSKQCARGPYLLTVSRGAALEALELLVDAARGERAPLNRTGPA